MTIATRETEIVRIHQASFQAEVNKVLEEQLQAATMKVVQTTIEAALVEELKSHQQKSGGTVARRSGYHTRGLETRYGRIKKLSVPKLRAGNKEREWQILTKYQRCRDHLLDLASQLYVMGLSLRDLQEALYLLLGHVLSRSSVNQVTLRVQQEMDQERQAPILKTPPILIVDGVWVTIQYTLEQFKVDRAGHRRQQRQAQERVILVAMAVWPDGSYHILHYMVATTESDGNWRTFFDQLLDRGLQAAQVKLVVSDGTRGLAPAMKKHLPMAKQQRCIAHKVRGMKRHLAYKQLVCQDEQGHAINPSEARQQRYKEIATDAFNIYDAPSLSEATHRLEAFNLKWQPLEPQAVHAFNWGISKTFSFYAFGNELWVHIRTSNHLERFFRQFRNKADEIGAFPNETSCLTLFYLVMLRDHAKHDRLNMAKN